MKYYCCEMYYVVMIMISGGLGRPLAPVILPICALDKTLAGSVTVLACCADFFFCFIAETPDERDGMLSL